MKKNLNKMRKKKKLAVLYLYADKKKNPSSYGKILNLLNNISDFEITFVGIDNFNENKKYKQYKKNIYDIGGDNSCWEFSGWRKGLKFLLKNKLDYDLVLFVNDSFLNRSDKGYDLEYYKLKINNKSLLDLKKDEALGIVDSQSKKLVFQGYDCSSWIRTCIFVIPKPTIEKLKFPFVDDRLMDKISPKNFDRKVFRNTNLLNNNFKNFLIFWMTQKWYRKPKLIKKDWYVLRSKIKAALNEVMLTAKLRENNVKIININIKS